MAYFKHDLYVGTGRNIPYMAGEMLKMAGIIDPDFEFPYITHPRGSGLDPATGEPTGDSEWAEDMTPEIWHYHRGKWKMVYRPSLYPDPSDPEKFYPQGIGFRIMTTFDGAIYAGVGAGFGPVLLVMSEDGENWYPVKTTPTIPWPSDTRALAEHNGKLYLGTSSLGDEVGEIYASENPNPLTDTWEKIVDFGSDNTAVASLISFNRYLYATTQNFNGFEVWRSNARAPDNPADEWTRVVSGGAGDAWNILGGTMEAFRDQATYRNHLYVGSMSLPIPPMEPKGFDLIRINKRGPWRLIVGDYIPHAPTVPRGLPLSGWPGGFGNPLNLYCWSLEVYRGYLYLGTFDASTFLTYLTQDDQDALGIQEPSSYFAGADLWKSPDGIRWTPVSLNGFNNPNNYGIRTMVSARRRLFVGTANPFEGCEVWVGRTFWWI